MKFLSHSRHGKDRAVVDSRESGTPTSPERQQASHHTDLWIAGPSVEKGTSHYEPLPLPNVPGECSGASSLTRLQSGTPPSSNSSSATQVDVVPSKEKGKRKDYEEDPASDPVSAEAADRQIIEWVIAGNHENGFNSRSHTNQADAGVHSRHRDAMRYIVAFTRICLVYAIPSHRSESMLNALAQHLDVHAYFILFPGLTIISFHSSHSLATITQVIKASPALSLGHAHQAHRVYTEVMANKCTPGEGTIRTEKILDSPNFYPKWLRCLFAFGCGAAICPLSFGGGFADMWIAGCLSGIMTAFGLFHARQDIVLGRMYELMEAVVVSFAARGLAEMHQGKLFCYEAISSAGVVLILPGLLVLMSSLDLANKHTLSGSINLVYTLTYTLFLAFCLTFGSDLFVIVRDVITKGKHPQSLAGSMTIVGSFNFSSTNITGSGIGDIWNGTLTFVNSTNTAVVGCTRDLSWGWYTRPFPVWSKAILVPAYSFFVSLHHQQNIRSRQFVAMIFISVAAYTANYLSNRYLFQRSEVVTTVGAFVVGVLANLYSRLFKGSRFSVSVTGFIFLVPNGLSAVGGLGGSNSDYFGTSLEVAGRMLHVGIGITIGMLFAMWVVFLFGKSRRAAFNY